MKITRGLKETEPAMASSCLQLLVVKTRESHRTLRVMLGRHRHQATLGLWCAETDPNHQLVMLGWEESGGHRSGLVLPRAQLVLRL